MRTIYENYRGFKISKDDHTYSGIQNEIIFSECLLSEVMDSIDQYVEVNLEMEDTGAIS